MTEERDPEAEVLAALGRLGAPHEVVGCDPEAADTAAFCERYGYPAANTLNTILVVSRKEPRSYAVCVVRSSTRLDVNHAVKRLMGASRVSFASVDETLRVTGMRVGGVTPFGLPEDMAVYVDAAVLDLDYVILGGGGRSSKIKASPQILRSVPGVRIVPELAG